jgi:hypothetical protein
MASLAFGKVFAARPGFSRPDIRIPAVCRVAHGRAVSLARASSIPHRNETAIRRPES